MAQRSYVRTQGGEVVHLPDCWHLRRVKRVWPWKWAEGKTVAEIEKGMLADAVGPYLFCRDCFGAEYEPDGEGGHRPSQSALNARYRELVWSTRWGKP